jgi:hypothetical protein
MKCLSDVERVNRFLSYTLPQVDPNGCWEWQAYKDKKGYGGFGVMHKRVERAHRYSYRNFRGSIPVGMCVLHACDNPSCVNPAHLWLGTDLDNATDRDAKGRRRSPTWERHGTHTHPESFPRGEAHHKAKINNRIVRDIRKWAIAGVSYPEISARVGLCQRVTSAIARGQYWKHVPGPVAETHKRGLPDDTIRAIRILYVEKQWSQQRIADKFKVNQTLVGFIVRGVYYKDVV